MANESHIRNPVEWGWDLLKGTKLAVGSAAHSIPGAPLAGDLASPVVRRIEVADLKEHSWPRVSRTSEPIGPT